MSLLKAKEEISLQSRDGKQSLVCTVVRSKRKSYGIVVDEEARVFIRIPLRGSMTIARNLVREKGDWIFEKVALQEKRKQQREEHEVQRNSDYTPQQREGLEKRYREAAKEYIPKRADYYADLLGVSYERIRVAEQKTRWGSCSSKGTLSFNWKLMLAPPKVLDYVVVHEVCHIKEMNHSPRFWKLVEELMPDYKEYRKWLKENGSTLQL
jgi:predicted metal-dependent hydrolase